MIILQRSIAFLVPLSLLSLSLGAATADDLIPVPPGEKIAAVTVTGNGEVQAAPDQGMIDVGVLTQAESAAAAVDQNSEQMQQLLEFLKRNGISDKDVRTVVFDVSADYQHDRMGEQPPRLVGYRVMNRVRIQVRELDRLGKLLDQLVTAGANEIHRIELSVSDQERKLDEARQRAFADARRKAELYARAAGVVLGPPLAIQENSTEGPRQFFAHRAAQTGAADTVPIATGEQTLRVSVTVSWQLNPRSEAYGRR